MLLFLHAWRNAAVVMIAIPTSILSTFVVMNMLGFHLDSMSLMGLSLIIGILVDDSIVVLENITRHRDLGQDPEAAAITGRTEIGGAALAITMVDVVVFLPIAFLPGIVGKYLKEYALVVVVATLFSLFVSFTLTPLLAAKWSVLKRSMGRPRWMDWFKNVWLDIGLTAAGIGLQFTQNNFAKICGVFLIALVLLNMFVQRYDRILEWYRTKALQFGLAHGFFIVFVCAVLFFNAILLMGGGMTSSRFDILVLGILGVGLLLGFALRRLLGRAELSYSSNGSRHGNLGRFLVRSIRAFGTNRPVTVATFAVPLALALIMPIFSAISTDFVPSIQTGEISMTVTYPPGTPIATTAKYVNQLETGIMKVNGIKSVSSTVGRKPFGWGSAIGGNYARLNATTFDNRRHDTNTIIEKIRKLSYLAPGGKFQVAGDTGGGSGSPIFYSLSGPEDEIDAAAEKVAQTLRTTPGSVNVETSSEVAAPRLNVHVDPRKAAILGVSPGAAATAARIAVDGAVATKVRTDNGLVDVRVQFPQSDRNTVDALRAVRIRADDGTLVPLADVASFSWTKAPTKIDRLNRQRVVNVFGSNLPEYSLGAVTGPLERKLRQPGFLPPGVALTAQGDTQYMIETGIDMMIALAMSFLLVYMLMVILYGSFLEPLIVMFSVPLAIIGALVALAVMHKLDPQGGQSLNILSMLGIVMLFGLVAKNGILLVDYSNTLVKRGMRVREAVLQAASTRFRPILMTTCAMVFGMLPLAIGLSEGAEWRQAMGTVIIGGLISSLILTLFLVPMIYNTWMGYFEQRADRRAVSAEMQREPALA
jgi:HAE1 family hydrophobic/amphiphilic exporter-1